VQISKVGSSVEDGVSVGKAGTKLGVTMTVPGDGRNVELGRICGAGGMKGVELATGAQALTMASNVKDIEHQDDRDQLISGK
jgi:hypothetical protein